MTAWSSIMSYWTILGMAGQSARWEQAMNSKLLELARAAEKQAALQISAAEQESMSAEAEEAAAADKAAAAKDQEEAAALLEESETNSAAAAAIQTEAEEVEAEIVVEEEEASAHEALALADEVEFDAELSEATADAAEAGRLEAQAHGEELGIGVCEFIPLLDIVCDVVGGVTAVGLESMGAAEAAKASFEAAVAASTKVEEEREVALAAEIQAKVIEDAAAATELEGEEAELAEIAEEERLEAEEKEAEAEALVEKSELEDEAAADETALAAEEETEADSLAVQAIAHGVQACWYAIVASLSCFVAGLFFSFRIVKNSAIPLARNTYLLASQVVTGNGRSYLFSTSLCRNISYIYHHCAFFLLTLGIFSNFFDGLAENTNRARGGIVLCFGYVGSCIHLALLDLIPRQLAKPRGFLHVFLQVLLHLIIYVPFFVIEMLIVWVNFGPEIFCGSWLHYMGNWWILSVLGVPYLLHVAFLEIPLLQNEKLGEKPGLADTKLGIDEIEGGFFPNETDSLLLAQDTVQGGTECKITRRQSWFALLREEIVNLRRPSEILMLSFEILMLSCMIWLTVHCISSVEPLWPASKALLLAQKPDWLIPAGTILAVVLLAWVVFACVSKW